MSAEPQYTQEQIQIALERIKLKQTAVTWRKEHRRDFSITRNGPMTADDWYPWQLESFFSPVSQVMILAANRTGKTLSAGYQVALHMTGDYPRLVDWLSLHTRTERSRFRS